MNVFAYSDARNIVQQESLGNQPAYHHLVSASVLLSDAPNPSMISCQHQAHDCSSVSMR